MQTVVYIMHKRVENFCANSQQHFIHPAQKDLSISMQNTEFSKPIDILKSYSHYTKTPVKSEVPFT